MTPAEIVALLREVAADAKEVEGDYYGDQFAWQGAGEVADAVEQLAAEIERLREERRWISVGERLPEVNQSVLGCYLGNVGEFWFTQFGFETERGVFRVTHWMPLPPPPEVE